MTQNGYLVIADLAGYTEFLNDSKLDHAVDTLRYLFNNILDQIQPPFSISKLEGDAVFAIAPEGSFLQGQTLLESIERIYYGYALAWERLTGNPDCDCNACQLTRKLDLKFVAHYGTFAQQDHGNYVELVGRDVNIVHRLLKNHITEKTNIRSYAFFTKDCAEASSLGEMTKWMIEHAETYKNIGEVSGYVYDLSPVLSQEREKRSIHLNSEEAGLEVVFDVPVSPALAWDYLTEPDFQRRWREDEKMIVQGQEKGRMVIGTVVTVGLDTFAQSDELVADWQPVDYLTYQCMIPNANNTKIRHLLTAEMTPIDTGTRIAIRIGTPRAQNPRYNWLVWIIWWLYFRWRSIRGLKKSAAIILQEIEADNAAGKIKLHAKLEHLETNLHGAYNQQ
jgi:uncharacterized protein YndB with AHSA1/START domain